MTLLIEENIESTERIPPPQKSHKKGDDKRSTPTSLERKSAPYFANPDKEADLLTSGLALRPLRLLRPLFLFFHCELLV